MQKPPASGVSISLSASQISRINSWIYEINIAHSKEECLPPGFELVISFAGPFGHWADAVCGDIKLELGEVEITPAPVGWGI
jgi:hypothetical protein